MVNNETVSKLYKYSSADKYTLANLKTSTIFLNKISNFNDIHEMDFWFDWGKLKSKISDGLINFGLINCGVINKEKILNSIDQDMKKPMEKTMMAFSEEYKDKTQEDIFLFFYEKMREDLQKNIQVSCFTTTPSNPTMWSHYADISSGIVQEYNMADISSAIEEINQKNNGEWYDLIEVIYSDEKIELNDLLESYILLDFYKTLYKNIHLYSNSEEINNIITTDIEIRISAHHQLMLERILNLLKTKSTNWSYEKEWRLVQININEIPNPKLNVPPTKVYLGEKMDITIKNLVMDLVDCEIMEAAPNIFNPSHDIKFAKTGLIIT